MPIERTPLTQDQEVQLRHQLPGLLGAGTDQLNYVRDNIINALQNMELAIGEETPTQDQQNQYNLYFMRLQNINRVLHNREQRAISIKETIKAAETRKIPRHPRQNRRL